MSSEWPMQDLGSLISYRKGFAFKSKDYISSGVPIVRVSNFTDDSISPNDLKFVSPDVAKETPEVSLEVNDIVVATVGSWPNNPASVVGRTIRVPAWAESALMNQNSVIIRAKSKSLTDQKFIYYQMRSQDFSAHVVSKAQGSANQASITLDAIFSYRLFWPKVEHRDVIVTFLSHLDDRITLLRETNTTLEAIAQGLFKSWFVDFDPVYARARGEQPPGLAPEVAALFPDSFEESELGMVPKGWKLGTIGDFAEQKKGSVNPLLQPETLFEHFSLPAFDNQQTPVLELGTEIKSNKTPLPKEAVLLSKLNPHIPRLWLPIEYGGAAVCSTEFLAYSPKGASSKEFIYCAFSSEQFIQHLCQLVTGTSNSHQRVKPDQVLLVAAVLPSDEVFKQFELIANPLFAKVHENRKQAQTLATLRDTLLPRLISGQLRLPEAEEQLSEAGLCQ